MQSIYMAYQELANAIVLQAVEDYRNALNGNTYKICSPKEIIDEVERFFRSKWYVQLTKVDGEYLIEKLKQEHIEQRKEQLCESR